ncbi:MAG: transcription-repair coupling factor [Planctomycetota bacterium]
MPGLLLADGMLSPVLEALGQGRSAAIDGAWGSSAGLAVAALAAGRQGPLLVVIPLPRDLHAWQHELASFGEGDAEIFPALTCLPGEDEASDPATPHRLRTLARLSRGDSPVILATPAALLQPVPSPESLDRKGWPARKGDMLDLLALRRWLAENGYSPGEVVEGPGSFASRGGIIDIWSPEAEHPVRLELFGDEIEGMRPFSPATQRALEEVSETRFMPVRDPAELAPNNSCLSDHLGSSGKVVLAEPGEIRRQAESLGDRTASAQGTLSARAMMASLMSRPRVDISSLPESEASVACHLAVESVARLSGNIQRVRDELDQVALNDQVLVACQGSGETARLGEVLAAGQVARADRLRLVPGFVRSGFRLLRPGAAGVVILGSQDLFHREVVGGAVPGQPSRSQRKVESRAIDSFLELAPGDLVVHVSHGIARFEGMELLDRTQARGQTGTANAAPARAGEAQAAAGSAEEHLVLEFRDRVRVFVPISKINLVQKYVGASGAVELSRFGSASWQRKRDTVAEAVIDLAADMIQVQAARAARPGRAWPADSQWMREFEASFPYQETPDQLAAMAEIKADLEKARPMDRLVCGDVGFGKTELALRAAFKVADSGGQVAVLVPTTVLAEQHYRTFSQRMAEYPLSVACLNRFRPPAEQRRIIKALAEGSVDVVIGTHRLVSRDVSFRDLGLAVIDEEQRFGVEHKEKLKQLREKVDVLTMTATPIPRTLHLALLGIRDISNLETPPPDRQPVETRVTRFEDELVRQAILREMNRDGQVFFVHNRVHDIKAVEAKLQRLVPEARIVVAHGQMDGDELENAMVRFLRREADILLSTTIIESGLDIPSANTIFIDDADTYGLAELHQLRGRVGRSRERAFAYLLVNPSKILEADASKRLKAIEEFTALGSGFKIALRDLEIRGAGNILGTQQSGHIATVGYEMYCQLLDNAVRQMRNQPLQEPVEVNVDLGWPAYLPADYVPGQRQRIEVYRRLARVRELSTLEDFRRELRDRFGQIPAPVEWLVRLAEVRIRADGWKVASVHYDRSQEVFNKLDIVFAGRDPRRLDDLARRDPRLRRVDALNVYLRPEQHEREPDAVYRLVTRALG